jgi:uncharacterized protein (DUF1330 family)
MVEQHGGKYLARTASIEKIEGDRSRPQIIVMIEWPSKEAAMAFYQSEEYRPYRQSRLAGSNCEFLLVAGEDISKKAQIDD